MTKKQRLQELIDKKNPLNKVMEGITVMKGEKGDKGEPGNDGKTPVKGYDYFTDKEITGIINYIQSNITLPEDGEPGEKGDKGEAPIRGIDYWTKEDKEQILEDVLKKLPKPAKDKPLDIDFLVGEIQKKTPPINFSEEVGKILATPGFRMLLHGGGLSVVSHDGTLTGSGTPADPLIVVSGGTDEKVKYDAGDPTAGYLSDKTIAGTGISLSEGTGGDANKLKITNSLPDQTVSITDSGIATVTGTYPNFNIDVPATDLSGYFKLDQTTPQTVINGAPLFNVGLKTPKIYPSADSTTAIQITKADGTTSVLNVDTTNGRVGIGTTAPGAPLEILSSSNPYKGIRIASGASNGLYMSQVANSYGYIGSGWYRNSDLWRVWDTKASNIVFDNSSGNIKFNANTGLTNDVDYTPTTRMVIQASDGNVGIGTTAPAKPLTVMYPGTQLRLAFNNSTEFTDLYADSAGGFIINTAANYMILGVGTEKVRLTTTGFGIGDTAPGAKLSVIGNAAIGYASGQIAPSNGLIISGNVGIGTTAPGQKLEVGGRILTTGSMIAGAGSVQMTSDDPGVRFQNNGANSTVDKRIYDVRAVSYNPNSWNYLQFRTVNDVNNVFTERLSLSNSGGMHLGSTYSDPGAGSLTVEGNVGIGTTNPGSVLDVAGAAAFNPLTTTAKGTVTIGTPGATGASLFVNTPGLDATYNAGFAVYGSLSYAGGVNPITSTINLAALGARTGTPAGYSNMAFFVSTPGAVSEAMRITSSGNVGIGTTAPGAKLEVTGINPQIRITNTGSDSIVLQGATGGGSKISAYDYVAGTGKTLHLQTDNNNLIIGESGGNVGIGTTGPTAYLHIKAGTATAGTAPLKLTSGTLNTNPEAGAIEFNSDAYYGSITTGPARKQFAFLDSTMTGIWNGTAIGVAKGGNGLTTVAAGSVLGYNTLDTASAITSTSGTKVLTNTNGTITWETGGGGGATTALDNLASVAINTTLVSDTDNTDALGTAAISWSDLFLGNGSVITWSSAPSTADLTLTHSANLLTLAGGDLALGANNLTMTGSLAATGSRVTKGWFTDLESTNMPTVGGTAILTSLTAPQFTTIELGAASDTTLARVSAGVISVEGKTIPNITDNNTWAGSATHNGTVVLGEVSMQLDPAISADGKWSGITETGTAGTALTFGQLCYYNSSNKWVLAKADSSTTSTNKLGICILEAAGDTAATEMLLYGKVNAAAQFPTLTIGAPVYISAATGGAVVTAQPSATDNVIRIIGYGNTADELFFCPDNTWITHT